MSIFYVVATPIGNLEDITLRALDTLKKADVILCEDTRVTKRLLTRHGISTRMLSYHTHSTLSRTNEIIEMLKKGESVALVSDAGTPGISDPGSELVRRIRQECSREIILGTIRVEAIPGPSAVTAALSIAGISCSDFTFLGFLPHKKGRQTLFAEIKESKRTVVFYESPHRIMKTLEALLLMKKQITICRELTKISQEVVTGTVEEVRSHFVAHPDKVKGEFVVIVSA